MKIKVAILDSNHDYLKRLVAAFDNRYADQLEIYSFTSQDVAISQLKKSSIDVLLCSESFEINKEQLPKKCGFAYLVDAPEIELLRNDRTICRFQKAELIYKQILSIYSEHATEITGLHFSDKATNIVIFTSAGGGAGSSTLAAACALNYAKEGKKVLYMNFEKFGEADLYFNGEGQFDFGDVLYAIKSKKANLSMKIQSNLKQDVSGVQFFSSCQTSLDFMEMKPADLKVLLRELRLTADYDVIIIDADWALDEVTLCLIKECVSLVFVLDGTARSNLKFTKIHHALEVLENQSEESYLARIGVFYNQFSDNGKQVSLSVEEFGQAPQLKGFNQKQLVQKLSEMNLFTNIL